MVDSGLLFEHNKRNRFVLLTLALLPFISIPLLGSFFYFRHDDSAMLLWAKEFTQPLLDAFSANPNVNHYSDYPGMGAYWRPFTYLYVKVLWNMFGTAPSLYYVVGGVIFMLAVLLLFKMVEQRFGLFAALLSCLSLFAAFNSTMYNLFHLSVEVSFFFQIGMIYFFYSFLHKQNWFNLAGMVLFLGPAMVRQTTPAILIAIFVVRIFEQHRAEGFLSKKNLIAATIIIMGFYLMTLSPQTSEGSVLSVFPNMSEVWDFVLERFFYYGSILTSGLTGIILLLCFGGGVLHKLAQIVKHRFSIKKIDWVWPLMTMVMSILFMRIQPFAVYWLLFCCLFLFVFDRELRIPLAWAGASVLSFLAVRYYHNGYLLEAGFGFAMASGIILNRMLGPVVAFLKTFAVVRFKRVKPIGAGVVLLVLPAMFIGMSKVPFVSDRIEVIQMAIDSNRNFQHLISYMQHSLPRNSIVYELSEEELGTTLFERRFLSLKERAARVKVMGIADKLVMLKVLDRSDIRVYPTHLLGDSNLSKEGYLIALNNLERETAEARFQLKLIKEFQSSRDSAAIYGFAHDLPNK